MAALSLATRANTADWVSQFYLGGAYEFLARRVASHLGGTNNATSPWRGVLGRALVLLRGAADSRLVWAATVQATELLPQAEFAPPASALYNKLGGVLLWLDRREEALTVFVEGVETGVTGWVTPWARPLHAHALMLPAPTPLLDRRHFRAVRAVLEALEAELPAIRDEFEGLMGNATTTTAAVSVSVGEAPLLLPDGFIYEAAGLHDDRKWSVLLLGVNGEVAGPSCAARTPRTCRVLRSIPLAAGVRDGQAKFSVLQPGAHILPHSGPTNARLRVHCTVALLVGGPAAATMRLGRDTRVHWQDGQCFAFDESFEHEVTTWAAGEVGVDDGGNDGDGDGGDEDAGVGERGLASQTPSGGRGHYRAVLLVDIANPLLASLEAFQQHGVSARGWAAHGADLKAAWEQTRDDVAAMSMETSATMAPAGNGQVGG